MNKNEFFLKYSKLYLLEVSKDNVEWCLSMNILKTS